MTRTIEMYSRNNKESQERTKEHIGKPGMQNSNQKPQIQFVKFTSASCCVFSKSSKV